MKKQNYFIGFCLLVLIGIVGNLNYLNSANITPGYSFGTTEQVTAAKLALLASGTVTNIDTADIADSAITTLKLGANSVTTAKILQNNVTGGATGSLAVRTVASTNIIVGAVSETELSTNIFFRAGTLSFTNATLAFTNNQIAASAVVGVTNSAGAGSANAIVKLTSTGLINTNMLPVSVFSGVFTSADQTITAGSTLTIAHSLGSAPSLVIFKIKCTSADLNYAINDEVFMPGGVPFSGSNTGAAVYSDATNVYIALGSTAGVFPIINKTSFAFGQIDASKWVLIVRAWK